MTTHVEDRQFGQALVDEHNLLQWICDWIQGHMDPEAVFTETQLTVWATQNGWEKKDQ